MVTLTNGEINKNRNDFANNLYDNKITWLHDIYGMYVFVLFYLYLR